MYRAVYISLMIVVLFVSACNTKDVEESHGSSDLLYTHKRELKQNFEGVKLTMTYVVRDAGDTVHLEVTGTLQNDFSNRIYYTPAFLVETANGQQYARDKVLEVSLAPAQQLTFTEVIELPTKVYETSGMIQFFVPAAFTQAGSTSSGDALGDTVWWALPLK